MGKGNCLIGFATMGVGAIRSVISCMCCLACLGPLLFLIGVIMLISPNNYKENTDKYNAAVANYTAQTEPALKASTATYTLGSGVNSMSLQDDTVTVKGNSDNLQKQTITTSYFRSSSSSTGSSNSSGSTSTSSGSFAPKYSTSAAGSVSIGSQKLTQTGSKSISCTDKKRGCTRSQMESKCRTAIGCSSGTVTVSSCSRDCTVSCQYTKSLSGICKVMAFKGAGWTSSTEFSFCDYPFTGPTMACGTNSGGITYSLRAATDPYIVLEKLTKGTSSFGLTEAQQRITGLVLMVIGGSFIACIIGLCVAARKACSDHQNKGAIYGAFGRPYQYPAGYQQQQQQPMMQQQQPMQQSVMAPQPGYAQPVQPGYGQPQPMMQQQPGYGQPQPGYGQPQPGYGQQHGNPHGLL